MKIGWLSKSYAMTLMLVVSAISAEAQSFPPTLASPTQYTNIAISTNPAMAVLNGVLYIAYVDNSGTSGAYPLYVTSSTDGVNWSTPVLWAAAKELTSPGLAAWNNELWVSYVGDPYSSYPGALYVTHAANPQVGPTTQPVLVDSTGTPYLPNSSPNMFVFNGNLYFVAVTNLAGSATTPETFFTSNGTTFLSGGWCINDPLGYMPQTGAVIGVTAFNGQVYYAYQTQGGAGGHTLRVCQTNLANIDPTANFFSPGYEVGGGVNATVWGSNLVLSFKDFNSHDLILEGSTNGETYSAEAYPADAINGNNQITPGSASFNGKYYAAFTANSGSHYLNVTHSE